MKVEVQNADESICCARCTHLVEAGQPRFKVGRYIYGECCILKVEPTALEQVCS